MIQSWFPKNKLIHLMTQAIMNYEKCDSIQLTIQAKTFDSGLIHDSNRNRLRV